MKDKGKLLKGLSKKEIGELKKSLYFTNLQVEPWEVMLASYISFLVSFLLMAVNLVAITILLKTVSIHTTTSHLIVVLGILPMLLVPLIVMFLVMRYPTSNARRLRIRSFSSQTEVVNYLSMSMRLKPSLEEAVKFAADNVEEPLATGLQRVLWDVYTRKHESIEHSLAAFAEEWGEFNDNFKRAIFVIISAQLESTLEGRQHALQRANDQIIQGNQQVLEEHRAKLSGPTMVMFSVCILLPLIISTLLPMTTVLSIEISTIQVAFFLDLLVPLAAFLYAMRILSNRPEAVRPPRVPPKAPFVMRLTIGIIAIVVGVLLAFIIMSLGGTSVLGDAIDGMAIAIGIGTPIALFAYLTSREEKKIRTNVLQIEEKLPDALFHMGSRILEGIPLELAMQSVGDALASEAVGKEFKDMSYRLQISKQPADEVFFGPDGYLTKHPSSLLRSSMGIVVQSTTKDAITAGKLIMEVSSYIRDLKKSENDIRISMTDQISSMQNTAMVFAPVSLGITTSLYLLMLDTFSHIDLPTEGSTTFGAFDPERAIPLGSFSAIIGVYLILSLLIIVHFSTGILYGDDNLERKHTTGQLLPIALLIFAVSFMLGNSLVS